MSEHRFAYDWSMKTGYPAGHGCTVFSTFSCGGGSSMGYKLAGFDVLGCLEIDQEMFDIYMENHRPAFAMCEDIRGFKDGDIPEHLYCLDILDGSPPCSSFSMAGNRERDWGKDKKFREGQVHQRLDDLFFEFIALAAHLKPRIVIAENVRGLVAGNAKGYLVEIIQALTDAGYTAQVFVLNAASMGVPQRRERVFIIAMQTELDWPQLELKFNEPTIAYRTIKDELGKPLTETARSLWALRERSDRSLADVNLRLGRKGSYFSHSFAVGSEPLRTILASDSSCPIMHDRPLRVSDEVLRKACTFPSDFDYGEVKPRYVMGMSVPPVMMAQVAAQVYEQWLAGPNDPMDTK